ncbi:unnamed protein product [Paramecium octaurelia]|uniref:Uncharacterized protein n=1 Tax=Paramecium octaurelia TaxID=43137 RepID=A0A8S1U591_PAROT|nr:unnamed protein product [Paramecium octaurelia]
MNQIENVLKFKEIINNVMKVSAQTFIKECFILKDGIYLFSNSLK